MKEMGSLMKDIKRQASFFLKERINTARLALDFATPAQLLAEEVVNGNAMAADGHAMRQISRAAFEVDDYERIMQVLHHRLSKFEKWNWRASYKALVLLEHLLKYGPKRTAEEFEDDVESIRDMVDFRYVDDKGFNWGLSVKEKSERVAKLLEDKAYLKEERAKARKLTCGIKGFGSFAENEACKESNPNRALRSKSLPYDDNDHHLVISDNFMVSDVYTKLLVNEKEIERNDLTGWSHNGHVYRVEEDHPFWDKGNQTRVSLLSSV